MSYQPLFLGLGTAVTSTDSNNNRLRGETANLRQGQPVRFVAENNGLVFGGVTANTVYYIKEIIDDEFFTVSATLNGDVLELLDGEGFMLVRSIQKELPTESLRKVDTMFKEIYTTGFWDPGTSGISSVEDDTNPTLGGNLNLNSNDITGVGNVNINGDISATVISADFRGTLAGGLSGPVDDEGLRIGNPTIDGLPFELGNPQPNQIIAWNGPEQKFVLTSLQAASGTDTLEDVLFRGNTSQYSINVSGVTTDTLTVNNGIEYSSIVNAPTDISSFTDTTNIIPVDVSDLTDNSGLLTQAGLGTRTVVSGTTGALLVNATGNVTIQGFKTYALMAINVEIPAWVRIYSSAAARTADASRLESQDPQPGSGIIAEVITTGNNQTVLFTPATIGFNTDPSVTPTIYLAVKNKGLGLATIQVNLTILQLEA